MGIGNIATTGMQAAMTNMEVISNNIANSNTFGYKGSYANFADMYPSGSNASSVQAGLGVSVSGIQQDFSPGGPTPTGIASDLTITNDGFFVLKDASSGQTSYSRFGRFNFNQGYFMVGNQRLQGFPAVNNTIPPGSTPTDLYINTASIPAQATGTITQQQLNLNASDSVPSTTPFDPNDPTSFNFSSTATVYDSLGSSNTLNLYYVKTAANEWTVNAYVNGTSVGTGSLTFSSDGTLSSATGLSNLSFSPTSGATSPQVFSVSMTGATQYANPYTANPFSSDGYAAGNFTGYTIDKNGKVTVNYSNNQTTVAGQIALAMFQSPQGLQNVGNMSWIATSDSGEPNVNQANSQNGIQQAALEMSNVDLASEMVSLITAQNIFQANAQVEQVYNQVMQTVTKLA
ncbi:flagellar hook protein FlgE [Aquicella lusitana]|uniref:Flagellar hook protein FlgE n=1 Tax=Aquicella lusitana TaxID=254246 RepID=A0A370G850_9COXI|nr:flagellar hook protein FlgE [Aquicella lusitana]RDI39958.1 flagellar hook protein FlgE [Aquicella lusitana]VVC74561.1 Flagellar hook protein FlgE [Aquicella lusitana]